MYSVDLVYGDVPGTVNGLLTSVRQPGKYLLELRDDVVLDDSCNGIRTHTLRTLKVFVRAGPSGRLYNLSKTFYFKFCRTNYETCEK